MRIKIIYTITIVLILLVIGITIFYDSLVKFSQKSVKFLQKGKCPDDSCGNWVYGSCIGKQLYMERGCSKYTPNCTEQTYFESKMETVGACSQSDCKDGASFSNYKCVYNS